MNLLFQLYFNEEAVKRKQKTQVILRNSFQSFTNLNQRVKNELVDDFMGYNIESRSRKIY